MAAENDANQRLRRAARKYAAAWHDYANERRKSAAVADLESAARAFASMPAVPVPMILHCPECHARHVDAGAFATKPHHTHACQSCGFAWRPAVVPTVGVQFLPGVRDAVDGSTT